MPRARRDHPWISTSIKRKCRKKHRLYKKAKKSNNPSDFAIFKSHKRSVEKEVKSARTNYINNQVLEGLDKGNTKPFYRYIKSLKTDSTGLAPLKSDTKLVTDPREKAEILLN